MCLRFVFLLIARVAVLLQLFRRDEAWKTAEILILRHQLAVLQRRQPRRLQLNWAGRALLATLLSVMPKALCLPKISSVQFKRHAGTRGGCRRGGRVCLCGGE